MGLPAAETMRHDGRTDGLHGFRQDHFPALQERPGLRRVEQRETRARGKSGAVPPAARIQQVLHIVE